MNTIRLVEGSANRLPGWGSPWKKPSIRTCLMTARMKVVPSASVSKPAARSSSTLDTLMPWTKSIVITRVPDSSS